jgi:hypothetical protein
MLGLPNFWECLNEPVIEFFKELYGPLEYGDISDYHSDHYSMGFDENPN